MQLVGTVIGGYFGPVGAFIGGMIGGYIDNKYIFPPDDIKHVGPRLEDTKVTASAYGLNIPKIWGRMRLPGNMIWATDIVEVKTTKKSGGGCFGAPEVKTTIFSYFANCAIAVCQGEANITKIWADSKLIYDILADVDAVTQMGDIGELFFYTGTQDQTPDITIGILSDRDIAGVPSYRGICYVVLTDFPLAKFGNRIPNFSFEVAINFTPSTTLTQIPDSGGETNIQFDFNDPSFVIQQKGSYNGWDKINIITGKIEQHVYDPQVPHFGGRFGQDERGFIYTTKIAAPSYGYPYRFSSQGMNISNGINLTASSYFALQYCNVIANEEYPWAILGYILGSQKISIVHRDGRRGQGNQYDTSGDTRFYYNHPTDDQSWLYADHVNGRFWTLAYSADRAVCDLIKYQFVSNLENPLETGVPIVTTYDLTASCTKAKHCLMNHDTNEMVILADGIDGGYTSRLIFFNVSSGTVVDEMVIAGMGRGEGDEACFYETNAPQEGCLWIPVNDGEHKVYQIHLATRTVLNTYYDAGGFPDFAIYSPLVRAFIWTAWSGYSGVLKTSLRGSTELANLSDVVTDICAEVGLTESEIDTTSLNGYYVWGFSMNREGGARGAMEALQAAYFFDVQERDGKIYFIKRGTGSSVVSIPEADLSTHFEGSSRPELLPVVRKQAVEIPNSIEVAYSDWARNYETGTQRARRQITESGQKALVRLPIVLTADEAKRVAEITLYEKWTKRNSYKTVLSNKYAFISPCDLITITKQNATYILRVDDVLHKGGILEMSLTPENASNYSSSAEGDTGYIYENPIAYGGVSFIVMYDLPMLTDSVNHPGLYFTGRGTVEGWRGVAIYKSPDGTSDWSHFATRQIAPVSGFLSSTLGDGILGVFDYTNELTVELYNKDDTLSTVTEADLLDGYTNWILVGDEIVQFVTAEYVEDGKYILKGLVRGRKGTEWAMPDHAAGEHFLFLDGETMGFSTLPMSEFLSTLYFKGVSVGENWQSGNAVQLTANFVTLKPYSPAAVRVSGKPSTTLTLSWKRRTRFGGEWKDSVGALLGETSEAYEIDIFDMEDNYLSTFYSNSVSYELTEADIIALDLSGFVFGSVDISVQPAFTPPSPWDIYVSRFEITEPKKIDSISAYCTVADALPKFRALIYDNTAVGDGEPNNLIDIGTEVVGVTVGWNDFPLSAEIVLPAGIYHIGWKNERGMAIAQRDPAGGNSYRYFKTGTYGDAPPDPFGPNTDSPYQTAVYAKYSGRAEFKAIVYQISAETGRGYPSETLNVLLT